MSRGSFLSINTKLPAYALGGFVLRGRLFWSFLNRLGSLVKLNRGSRTGRHEPRTVIQPCQRGQAVKMCLTAQGCWWTGGAL